MFWRIHVFGTKGWAGARDETTPILARNGEKPQQQALPEIDSLATLLEAFAESAETGEPFPVPTSQVLEVVGAFEAIVQSVSERRPIVVGRS
jgi:predicted dehydrogenase